MPLKNRPADGEAVETYFQRHDGPPEEIERLIRAHVDQVAPSGVRVEARTSTSAWRTTAWACGRQQRCGRPWARAETPAGTSLPMRPMRADAERGWGLAR
jgi:hypothetical protein